MTDSPARVAADVAALYPPDHPIARIARQRLEQEANTMTQIGTRLRDAAVDPQPGDFMAPVNAGTPGPAGNPHGPNVRSYEVDSPQYDRAVAELRKERGY